VDLDGRKIDVRLVNENDGLTGRMPSDKPAMREGKVRAPFADRFEPEPGGRSPAFKVESRKRGAAKSGRAEKASAGKSAGRSSAASKKSTRKR
jgi:hypothetical protein